MTISHMCVKYNFSNRTNKDTPLYYFFHMLTLIHLSMIYLKASTLSLILKGKYLLNHVKLIHDQSAA